MTDVLATDIETQSAVDIKHGVYRYVECPEFRVNLLSYAINNGPVKIVDLYDMEPLPAEYLEAARDPVVVKTAFNAAFERVCLRKHGLDIPIEQWQCTSVLALTLGLPQHLADVAKVLKLSADKQKMAVGKRLIRKFCVPQKRRKTKEKYWITPYDAPADWALFKEYCIRDTEVEREIRNKLIRWNLPQVEWDAYHMDQRINDRGIKVDLRLVANAIDADAAVKVRCEKEAILLTGLQNPNSVKQLKSWLELETLEEIDGVTKETVPALLAGATDDTVRRVLELRQEMSKTSVKKYAAMANIATQDHRIHGAMRFYGANRTGRWAGAGVQVHNLSKSTLKQEPYDDLDNARNLLLAGETGKIETLYGSVSDILSQLVRTAFVPRLGKCFVVVDFSAIEARKLAWLAQEQWRLDVFSTHGKIYEASAAAMFHVPIESIDKKNPLRQKGKVSELALGYQGGPGALITMGALKMGLTEDELPGLVKTWRAANEKIVQLWWAVDRAAFECVADKTTVAVPVGPRGQGVQPLVFSYESGMMFVTLPSGRRLAYVKPRIERDDKMDKDGVTYEGMNQMTKQWERVKTYGGKLVENVCQAACRDLLRDAMLAIEPRHDIVMHIHDEVVIETDDYFAEKTLHDIERIMGLESKWAPGLPLRGDGFISAYYKKEA